MAYDVTYYFENDSPGSLIAKSADWEEGSTGEYNTLSTSKASTSSTSFTRPPTCTTSPWDYMLRQFISGAITTGRNWTTDDVFDTVFTTYQDNDGLNATLYIVIRVLSGDLGTVRGTIYSGEVNNVEWKSSTYTRRSATGVAIQNSVTQQDGDRLVVEVGARCASTTSGRNARIYLGTGSATDLPLSDADVSTTGDNPWLAFTYGTAATATNVVMNII